MHFPAQELDPHRTTWHISVGTYGARLHGGDRITVVRGENKPGDPFIENDTHWEQLEQNRMRGQIVLLTLAQREHIERTIPTLCTRGGWRYRVCAAPADADHWHTLLDADPSIHGKQVRTWLKRWLTQTLDEHWPRPSGGSWWVEGGSTKPVKDRDYLNNAFGYIARQRTLALDDNPSEPGRPRPDDEPRKDEIA